MVYDLCVSILDKKRCLSLHIGFVKGKVVFAHNISHRHTESFLIHNHPTYELHYFVRGNASWLIDGVEQPCQPHTLMLFAPNAFHGIRIYDQQPYERFTLHFSADDISLERRAALIRTLPRAVKTGGIPCLKQNMEGTAMHALLLQLDVLAAQDAATHEKMTSIFVEALLSVIALNASPAQQAAEQPQLTSSQEAILSWLNSHFTEPITLDDLAERFFISKNHLNRSFRKATGTTVRDYLINKRVNYVQQLLINGIPATQAATLAGFGDYTAFYRAYVKRFGHAPSQDRNPSRTTSATLSEVLKEQQVITPDVFKAKLEEYD